MMKDEVVAEVASCLLDELHMCFRNLLDSKQEGHNPIYTRCCWIMNMLYMPGRSV